MGLFCLGLKFGAPGPIPEVVESKNGGEGRHTLCPNPIPGDSPNVEDIQDGTPGLLMVISLSLEGGNTLASVDTAATLSGLPGLRLLAGHMEPAWSISCKATIR